MMKICDIAFYLGNDLLNEGLHADVQIGKLSGFKRKIYFTTKIRDYKDADELERVAEICAKRVIESAGMNNWKLNESFFKISVCIVQTPDNTENLVDVEYTRFDLKDIHEASNEELIAELYRRNFND